MRPSARLLWLLALGSLPAVFAGVSMVAAVVVLAIDLGLLALFWLDWRLLDRGPRASVSRILPERVSRGRGFELRWELSSRAARPQRLEAWSRLPAAFEPREHHVSAALGGGRKHLEHRDPVTALVRGRYSLLPPAAERSTPLGLGVATVPVESTSVIDVLPDTRLLSRFDALVRQSRLHEMGLARVRERGEGTEIAGLRPYALGDPQSRVDWKATARRGALTAREMHTERRQNVVLLLDCGRRMAGESEGQSRLDHAIEAALLLSHVALRSDDRVGLVTFADRVLGVVQPVRGPSSAALLSRSLFRLEAVLREPPYAAIAAQVSQQFRRRSLIVLFTDAAEPAAFTALVKPLHFLGRRHLVMCVVLRDAAVDRALATPPASVSSLYRTGAAFELATEREHGVRQLERAGILVLQSPPAQLSTRVVNRYLEIKARHLL